MLYAIFQNHDQLLCKQCKVVPGICFAVVLGFADFLRYVDSDSMNFCKDSALSSGIDSNSSLNGLGCGKILSCETRLMLRPVRFAGVSLAGVSFAGVFFAVVIK